MDELRQLLDALAGRAEEYLIRAGEQDGSVHTGPGTCGWCPVCAVLAVMRGERPELTGRVVEQLAGIVALLRQAVADHASGAAPEAPDSRADEEPPGQDVQRIALQRVRGRVLREEEPERQQDAGC